MDSRLIIDITAITVVLTVLATLATGIEKIVTQLLSLQRTILKIYENQKLIDYRLTMLENKATSYANYEPGQWLDDAMNNDLEK